MEQTMWMSRRLRPKAMSQARNAFRLISEDYRRLAVQPFTCSERHSFSTTSYHYKKKSFISDKIFRRATDGTRMEHGFLKEAFQVKLRAYLLRDLLFFQRHQSAFSFRV